MESLPALFAAIHPYAWIGLLMACVFICLVFESGFFLTLGTIAFVIFGAATFNLVHIETLIAHPILIPLLILAYVAVGAIWVPFAWASYLRRIDDKVIDAKEAWDELPGSSTQKSRWQADDVFRGGRSDGRYVPFEGEELEDARRSFIETQVGTKLPVSVRTNKARVICYMAYWPFSMLRTLLDDPLRRLWNYIYYAYAERLQAMSNERFKEFHR